MDFIMSDPGVVHGVPELSKKKMGPHAAIGSNFHRKVQQDQGAEEKKK